MIKRLLYAKCPRCLRTDLTTWSRRFYQASLLQNVQLFFGGQRYRCSPCRCNFVSFKPRLKPAKGIQDVPEDVMESTEQSG
jgi:hypothetical protein